MAIELQESFEVAAPVEKVWQFLMTPENVVDCMPGGSLTEKLNDKSFVGTVTMKIGAITAKYSGTITYTTADVATRTVVMLAEAKEKGGGTVTGTITSVLIAQGPNSTLVKCNSSVDLTGKIVQLGRGMIDGVSAQIIGKFVKNVKALLEVPGGEAPAAAPTPAEAAGTCCGGQCGGMGGGMKPSEPSSGSTEAQAYTPPQKPKQNPQHEDSINVLAVLWATFVAWIKKLFTGKK